MFIIGVTGGSGSGKTTVSRELSTISGNSIDADKVYHEMLDSCIVMRKELIERFPSARTGDSKIDRAALGAIVFNDSKALADLNRITHPYVSREIERRIGGCYRNNAEMAIIDAALLFESGMDKLCDVTVGVIAPRNLRIERIIARDEIDYERAAARIDSQPKDAFYITKCSYIIDTGSTADVRESVEKLYQQIMEGMKLPNE